MKRVLLTICAVFAVIFASASNRPAQSTSKKSSPDTFAGLTFTVESMIEDGRMVEMPDGYSISIKGGKLTTYIPLSCSTEYHLLDSGVSNGLVVNNETVTITAKDRKGIHTLYFSVQSGIKTYRLSLSYSNTDSATLFLRGQDVYAEYQGALSVSGKY